MNKILIEKEIDEITETKQKIKSTPSTINNYYFTPTQKKQKEKSKVKEKIKEATDLDRMLENTPKEESLVFEEKKEVEIDPNFEEDIEFEKKTYNKKFPVVMTIIAGLLLFMFLYNIGSYVTYRIGIEEVKNQLTLQDLKLKKLVTQIGTLTGENMEEDIREQDYIKITDDQKIEITLNEKKQPISYSSTNWFDWLCNSIFRSMDK